MTTSTYWYIARGSGIVATVLLTLTVLLGVMSTGRAASRHWPRFLTQGLHRNASLIALGLIAVHIVGVVEDPYAKVSPLDTVIPFHAGYRPLWVGLGTLAADAMAILVLTSVARRWLPYHGWRVIHSSAYAAWALAVAHGFATGTDARLTGVVLLDATCLGLVVLAGSWRVFARMRTEPGVTS